MSPPVQTGLRCAMAPGGLIVVQDYMRVDHSPQQVLPDTHMDMYVLLAFGPGAGDRLGEEYVSWLEDTGFRDPRVVPLPTHLALITAEKPSASYAGEPVFS